MTLRTFQFAIECPLPADLVFDAMTDFSEERVALFPNLSRGSYAILERRGQTALVKEGTGPFYTHERYDWSTRGRIWSVVEESNVVSPGGITDVRITPRRDGGSRVEVRLEREFAGWRGRVILASIYLNGRSRFFRRTYIRMLRNVQSTSRKRRSKGV